MENNKKVYLNILRIIAAILVLINHSKLCDLYFYNKNLDTISNLFSICITPLYQIAVPLFLTISGAVLLNKKETIKEVLKKRVVKYLLYLIFASIIVYLVKEIENKSILDFFRRLLSVEVSGNYWYIYVYIGMLLILPYIRKIVIGLKKDDIKYLLIILFLIKTLYEFINYFSSVYGGYEIFSYNFRVPIIMDEFLFYPILGYYLEHCLDIQKIKKNKLLIILCIGLICEVLMVVLIFIHESMNTGEMMKITNAFTYVHVIVLFILVKKIYCNVTSKHNNGIVSKILFDIGKTTVGIYLLSPIIENLSTYKQFEDNIIIDGNNTAILEIFVTIIFRFVITSIITLFIQKIIFFIKSVYLKNKKIKQLKNI